MRSEVPCREGVCYYSNSIIAACQDPGSAYVDNKYFQMIYSRCDDVSTFKDQRSNEVDLVCFDILPRHHSVLRYRIGKPVRISQDEARNNKILVKKFRSACSWMSFTFNKEEIDWKYEVLILNPPAPFSCPIYGRYHFEQTPESEYDSSIIYIEMSDHELKRVGFWIEDYKSYLITWDEEDAISNFRCWVYDRLSWTDVMMSRSQNARYTPKQTADSYQLDGTGLSLKLTESERLFNDCPQRFDLGFDPYRKPTIIYILNKANGSTPSYCALLLTMFAILFTVK
ncbi:unnamed protein product [Mytilus coruscus]|uniref:Uncharacterized protein n=1 Tax=Mytilus coruscus TaxID=42192 RepID=A0A6J8ADA1_MYTCO|nr:unnamed protein product [Mytilus coruscus]